MQQEPKCTLTNEELIEKVKEWNISLAKSGGKTWTLQIPANVNEDPDLLIGELITRFKALLKPGGQSAGTWVKANSLKPKNGERVFIKNAVSKIGNSTFEGVGFLDTGIWYGVGVGIISGDLEWLNKSTLPDNKDREQAIGLLKTLCGLKQYKDAKGKDEYYEQQKELAWKEAFDFLKQIRQ